MRHLLSEYEGEIFESYDERKKNEQWIIKNIFFNVIFSEYNTYYFYKYVLSFFCFNYKII